MVSISVRVKVRVTGGHQPQAMRGSALDNSMRLPPLDWYRGGREGLRARMMVALDSMAASLPSLKREVKVRVRVRVRVTIPKKREVTTSGTSS